MRRHEPEDMLERGFGGLARRAWAMGDASSLEWAGDAGDIILGDAPTARIDPVKRSVDKLFSGTVASLRGGIGKLSDKVRTTQSLDESIEEKTTKNPKYLRNPKMSKGSNSAQAAAPVEAAVGQSAGLSLTDQDEQGALPPLAASV